jgi:GNAT superfamily N-acetyltransferase
LKSVEKLIGFLFVESTNQDAAEIFIDKAEGYIPSGETLNLRKISSKKVHIDQIEVSSRGRGIGSLVMGEVIRLADLYGIVLSLEVETFFGDEYSDEDSEFDLENDSGANRLMSWYEGFGFETDSVGDYGIIMLRRPE